MVPANRWAATGWVWRIMAHASAASRPARSGSPAWARWRQARAKTRVSPSMASRPEDSVGTGDLDSPLERPGFQVVPCEASGPQGFGLVTQRLGIVVVENDEGVARY